MNGAMPDNNLTPELKEAQDNINGQMNWLLFIRCGA